VITTVAQLLDALATREVALIERENIKHGPTIGTMYENLTSGILDQALPIDQNIQVVSGFIRGHDGRDSREMDCMVVLGEVEDIAYSTKKRVPKLSQVLAVVQVKKSLNGSDFADAHENIKSVHYITPDTEYTRPDQLAHAFETITGTPLVGDVEKLSPLQQRLFNLLRIHLNSPTCIVLGYYGYKGHKSFRRGLCEHLASTIGRVQQGPLSLPDVILNSHVAAVKNIAMPWGAQVRDDQWPLFLTARISSPHSILLEALWTRLAMRNLLSDRAFGDDLELEPWSLLALMRLHPGTTGWEITTYENVDVNEQPIAPEPWSPVFLTEQQNDFVIQLCMDSTGSLCIPDLKEWDLNESDIDHLRSRGLVGRDPHEPTRYWLLTRQCDCMILPDGRFVAGDNSSGRLTRWVMKFTRAFRTSKDGS